MSFTELIVSGEIPVPSALLTTISESVPPPPGKPSHAMFPIAPGYAACAAPGRVKPKVNMPSAHAQRIRLIRAPFAGLQWNTPPLFRGLPHDTVPAGLCSIDPNRR